MKVQVVCLLSLMVALALARNKDDTMMKPVPPRDTGGNCRFATEKYSYKSKGVSKEYCTVKYSTSCGFWGWRRCTRYSRTLCKQKYFIAYGTRIIGRVCD